eukprot:983823_1
MWSGWTFDCDKETMPNGDVLPVSIMGYEETVNENVYLCSQGGWIRGCTKINEFASAFTEIGDIVTIGTNVYQCSEKFEWIGYCKGAQINGDKLDLTRMGNIFRVNG